MTGENFQIHCYMCMVESMICMLQNANFNNPNNPNNLNNSTNSNIPTNLNNPINPNNNNSTNRPNLNIDQLNFLQRNLYHDLNFSINNQLHTISPTFSNNCHHSHQIHNVAIQIISQSTTNNNAQTSSSNVDNSDLNN
ncbi:hypothetical protein RclHR1_06060004 [Rhizophagus clarus]|uniref:Uncharacterized protein n=1 Tax=Rhizophagus clarus TaxID=94130 RepID=A0A2Z6RQJ8_9GLOM|nr:hypothetical protein RclHR1_06060004 [Rhizophagus clarus]GES88930.1 hypothetical protein GLOIN_2v1473828 [Rhizophagus clarus]